MLIYLTIATSACLVLLTGGHVYLLVQHFWRRHTALSAEGQILASSNAQPPAGQTSICVQLPIYNEQEHAVEAIRCLCDLDWPYGDFEVLVLDDSDDETAALVAAEVTYLSGVGSRVRVLRRAERVGYKAGALQNALTETAADLIALFDVDYRPARSFLRQLAAVLIRHPESAFVQARLRFRNRQQSWLTRGQALEQDLHYGFEQAARYWSGLPMQFNGTCGIWRKTAIEQSGGWSASTVGEDQELSWRAIAIGWRSMLFLSLSVEGELPATLRDLVRQRARWSKAAGQAVRGLPKGLMTGRPWHAALAFRLLSGFNTAAALMIILLLCLGLASWHWEGAALGTVVLVLLCPLVLIALLMGLSATQAVRAIRGRLSRALLGDLVYMLVMQCVLLPTNALAFVEGIFFRGGAFVRTPKTGR